MKGKVGWDSTFPIKPNPQQDRSAWHHRFAEAGAKPLNIAFCACPNCKKVEPSARNSFQLYDLDCKLQCKACLKSRAVKEWNCSCGVRWHTCPVHRCYANDKGMDTAGGNPSGRTMQPPSISNQKRKAPGQSPDFDEVLAEDKRRARQKLESYKMNTRKSGFITLGDAPTAKKRIKLPPSLEQRFFGTSRSSAGAT